MATGGELVPFRRQAGSLAPFEECKGWAEAFHLSGVFKDAKSAAELLVKIAAGAELGLPPFASVSGVHIIQGKPTLGAGAIAAAVKASGKYTYVVQEHDAHCCKIEFFEVRAGEWSPIGQSNFSIEDAKIAGLTGNPTWTKYPKAMLFARAISQGARWFCPDVFAGSIYTPEELEGVEEKSPIPAQHNGKVAHKKVETTPVVEVEEDPFAVEREELASQVKAAWKSAGLTAKADLFSRILWRKVTNLPKTLAEADMTDLMRLLIYATQEGHILPEDYRIPNTGEAVIEVEFADTKGEK